MALLQLATPSSPTSHSYGSALADAGNPILSVDTKKKELVGRFKNPGRVWAQKSDAVNDHDFRSMADGVAIPYGIYDLAE